METLVKPALSVEYELALLIVMSLLKNGLISKAEFAAIDAENRKTFLPEHP
ncbi:SHOCT domain-containing protein [Desulfosporosinus sp. FKA]|uniref:SHOCT domain-containing protein n=1 Tax=Desulfosporosinus sp. FKA TaxID=1969834 RepID=UPI001557C5D5|nr:SHOCT domain-containing protein [Desulfosporosinus sp. FKA]